jgi:aspartate/methionine/tyrosine aminotransferase
MFGPTRYLDWARDHYGKVQFDLATSGVPAAHLPDYGFDATAPRDTSGWERLADAIARYNVVSPEEAVATLGTTHALWLAYVSLTSAGDEVLIEDPAYEPLLRIAEGVGLRVVRFERPWANQFELDPDRVARAMTPRTRLIVVTNPSNPGGVRATETAVAAVAEVAARHNAFVLVDEVYGAFDDFVDARGCFTKSARHLAANILAASSLTKCFGLGAERIGWLLGPAEIIRRARDTITAAMGGLPLCHSHLGLQAFAEIQALALRARTVVGAKRDAVARWAVAHGLVWSAPRQGLFGFAIAPGRGDLTPNIEAAARTHSVLVAPGAFFGISNGFRIAWSEPVDKLDEGLARLADALTL